MTVFIDGKRAAQYLPQEHTKTKVKVLCIADMSEKQSVLNNFGFEDPAKTRGSSSYFESHNGYDYMCLVVPKLIETDTDSVFIEICFSPERLLLFHDHAHVVDTLLEDIQKEEMESELLERILYRFFFRLVDLHVGYLEEMEDEITDLEDAVATNADVDYVTLFSQFRKKQLVLKRYYESLVALMEDLEENQNDLLSDAVIRMFHFQTNKADRVYHSILNLRDYVTQVREAYQAQLDIQANKIMKLFTVITAIFLPLTLIAGWYGMNLIMPEYSVQYAYPILIVVSAAIIVGSVVYFRKHKWF